MVKCHIKNDWFKKTDSLGKTISSWASKLNDTEIFCSICTKTIQCDTKGFQAITQHVTTKIHSENAMIKMNNHQLHLTCPKAPVIQEQPSQACTTVNATNLPSLGLYSREDAAIKAEMIWTMKNVAANMSALSCDGLADLFRAMFPGGIPDGFSIGHTKLAYLITEALGPYFRQLIIKEIRDLLYTVMYDETTNSEGKKELQVAIRFWSKIQDQVVVHHLETFFMNYATGEDLAKNIKMALNNADISKNRMLMLSSDGPNVNKKVLRLISDEIKSDRGTGLLNIGTCNIHIVHNAFLKGLQELGIDISDLIINIYYFFNGWPARWEDYKVVQVDEGVPQHHFIKHVASRWLTLHPAGIRLLEQWKALVKYFLVYVPKHTPKLVDTNKYLKIVNALKRPAAKAEVLFVINSGDIFQEFTGFFQRQEPLVHTLYDKLRDLLLTLVGRVCKNDVLKYFDSLENPFDDENLLAADKVIIDKNVIECLSKLSDREKLIFRNRAQKHFVAAARHILSKSSLASTCNSSQLNIKHFRCLQPAEISKESSYQSILEITRSLPVNVSESRLLDEWKLVPLEGITLDENERIDHYWRKIFKIKNAFQESKYPTVMKVVKASLTLAHGSADVERAFSVSSQVLTDNKTTMTVRTLNARLNIKDGLKQFGNKPELVPIPKELLISGKQAHKSYQNYIAEQKRKALDNEQKKKLAEEEKMKEIELQNEIEKSKQSILELEHNYRNAKKVQESQKEVVDKMFSEANQRLKTALRKNDLQEVKLAQAMFEGAEILRKEERLKDYKAENLQKRIGKRQSSLITNFLKKSRKD